MATMLMAKVFKRTGEYRVIYDKEKQVFTLKCKVWNPLEVKYKNQIIGKYTTLDKALLKIVTCE